MRKIKDKKIISEYLHRSVFNLLSSIPAEMKRKMPPVSFYFEMEAICLHGETMCFAVCNNYLETKEITFYIDLISRTGTTVQGLDNLVLHEFAHALGMNEKEATKLTNNRISKNATD